MIGIILPIYGVYAVAVGYHGNSAELLYLIGQQNHFVYWLAAIIILYAGSKSATVRPVIKPFIFLAVVATIVGRYDDIRAEVENVKQEFLQ